MLTAAERLEQVRAVLQQRQYAAVIVPRADEYLGEYIPADKERLRWLTGFTGSAGIAVVLVERAAMFVDGRYRVQVREQVPAELFSYHHLIEEPPPQWLAAALAPGDRVAIDPRLHSLAWYEKAAAALAAAGIELVADADNLVDQCWTQRAAPAIAEAMLLEASYTGESSRAKRARIGAVTGEQGCDAALVFAPDSVSWLLNVRGTELPQLPILPAHALLEAGGELHLLTEPRRLPAGFADHVGEGVRVVPETELDALAARFSGSKVLLDPDVVNAWLPRVLEEAGAILVPGSDPVEVPRACKNAVELDGARRVHERDAVAVIRFLAWLDNEVAAGRLYDEALLAQLLQSLREEVPQFHACSFDTISAAGANAALCHYNHLNGEPAQLAMDSVYLVDSGGQYPDGTTDITRTVAIGDPGPEVRRLYTLVLKGHIALARAVFPAGTTGTHLDALARQFLWREGFDYDHGTGHGVGAFLSVHEGPQRISRVLLDVALRPGMIVSNEPGYYRDGAFGMRCENLLAVRERPGGQGDIPMLEFETLTLVPFDNRLLDRSLLDATETGWLDDYHRRVAATLAPSLDTPVRDWLQAATRPVA